MKKSLAIGIVFLLMLLTAESLSYKQFKQNFQLAALQCGVPFSLAESLIQKGVRAASMQVFFTKKSDMNLYMTPEDLIIKELTVSISGEKSNSTLKDIGYAYSVLWALESLQSQQEAEKFLQKIIALKVGEYLQSNSGFKYSHPELRDNSLIMFTAKNTKMN